MNDQIFFDKETGNFKTEYETMRIFSGIDDVSVKNIKRKRIVCEYCGSPNIEFYNIGTDDFKFYDFNRIVQNCIQNGEYFFMININKDGLDISLKRGGTQVLPEDFLAKAIEKVTEVVFEQPSSGYITRSTGKFFIAITGNKNKLKIQSLTNSGFTRNEILNAINQLKTVKNEKTIYTVAEFMDEFGDELDLEMFEGEINYNQILIGSETVLIEKSIIPEITTYFQFENDKPIDFTEYFIEANRLMYIPVYTLKKQ